MTRPKVSVVTPSYNSAVYIDDAIRSVDRQENVSVEHLVIDGVSTDGALDIVKNYAQVKWISEPDKGQSDAINKGFRRATGELVGWLNADDYYLPGALAAITAAADHHPEADVFYGDCVFVDASGALLRSKVEHEFDRDILMYFGCHIPSTSTFFRRRVLESGLLLDCDYRVCMDFEYFARLADAGFRFHYVPRVIAAFRWHEDNVSLTQYARRAKERLRVQRRFLAHRYSTNALDALAMAHRIKRAGRKILTGNIVRELRLRRMLGRDTRWLDTPAGWQTCSVLACL